MMWRHWRRRFRSKCLAKGGGNRVTDTGQSVSASDDKPLVQRSSVPSDRPYGEYRDTLRHDFFYACAYCTMLETEAHAIRFTIDHYEPSSAAPHLENEYSNLMWACDPCNTLKGDRCPPDAARAAGFRFFRPDEDIHQDHFQPGGIRIEHRTNVGYFTIEAIDLNREALLRLRKIRAQLFQLGEWVTRGVSALRRVQLDQLPPQIRGRTYVAIKRMERVAEGFENEVDLLLRNFGRSALIDPDTRSEEEIAERLSELKRIQGLFPGVWRGRDMR